jgi:nucleoside-diphosphate-sugar epimerase
MTSIMADYSHENPLVPADAVRRWVEGLPRPVAVTGGTGFIGSHLVDTLCAVGIEPRVLVRNSATPRWIPDAPVQWVKGSLADEAALDRLAENAGTVLHLAGVVRAADEAGFDRGNRVGTEVLARCVGRVAPSARLVVVSSLAAAGPAPSAQGVGPDDPAAPISSYGRSKLAAERVVTTSQSGQWWAVVRPPAVYGPRDTDVFEFFKMASRGKVVLPAGERWVTVAWVGDVVRSVLAAAAGRGGRIYHIGEPSPLTMDGLVATLCASGGVTARVLRLPEVVVRGVGLLGSALQRVGLSTVPLNRDKARELVARHWTATTTESMMVLDLLPSTGFAEGTSISWSWYRDQGWLRR